MPKAEKVRITVDLSAKLSAVLDELAEDSGKSKSELLRQAIDLMVHAYEAKHHDGMKVGSWSDDKQTNTRREREFIGI